MKTSAFLAMYEGSSTEAARAIGLPQSTVASWPVDGYPPALRQLQIEALTKGELVAEPICDPFRVPRKRKMGKAEA